MPFLTKTLAVALFILGTAPTLAQVVDDQLPDSPTDWPWWRGPERNGVANPDQEPPTEWSDTKNVAWKSPVPGRGYGSATVVGNRVFLATADEQKESQSLLCYDRATGKLLWETVVHPTGLMRKNHKSTGASSTPACDGERVYINFANSGAVYATALSLDGKQLWQTRVTDYQIHQGYGASPALYRSLVLIAADNQAGGSIAALDRKTGKIAWKRERPQLPNYTSPIIMNVAGKDQVIFTGCDLIASYDPMTGQTLWETKGGTTECVTSTVTDGARVFSTGGYPKNHLAAILADGSAKIVWETKDRVYVPSLLARDGFLFGLLDAGIAVCWKSDSGDQQWKKRLRGEFSASPVLVGDKIFATNEVGETFIYRANPSLFEEIAANKLGDLVMATPTIVDSRIYMRVTEVKDGVPKEMLYCLANTQ